ncbi:hypothetical protein HPT27_12090 [Permianibacter sp. IMCC34836]|uniref:hypothetical protein n=1 Tax=Permianibacter fluminis TaxID=2738515 RepID=UPI00155596C5|nr:hypothetical protein [Permianibacter fluminis]NQD37768.1 hypothetical protein [Permianibacter fluminis]
MPVFVSPSIYQSACFHLPSKSPTAVKRISQRSRLIMSFVGLIMGSAVATAAGAADRWVQVHADFTYSRTYNFARQEPNYSEKSQFTFNMNGAVDQMMWRMDPDKGEKYPTYNVPDEIPLSFKNSGSLVLNASFQSSDRIANRNDSGSASLRGTLKSWDDFHIEKISPESIIGVELFAQVLMKATLDGNVSSTLPKMPDSRDGDEVFIWTTPVKFDHDTSTFISEIQLQARTPLGPRPGNNFQAKLYDLTVAATELTTAPQIGGSALATRDATITGSTDNWTLKSSLSREVPIGSDRGSYQESMTITIRPVATTLKVPPSPVD